MTDITEQVRALVEAYDAAERERIAAFDREAKASNDHAAAKKRSLEAHNALCRALPKNEGVIVDGRVYFRSAKRGDDMRIRYFTLHSEETK